MGITAEDNIYKDLAQACAFNTRAYAKTFFPEEVKADFSILHDKIFEVLDNQTALRKAIAAPRGLGKTTLAKLRVCRAIHYRETHFIIYLSNSATSAEEQTEHIKRLLQTNELTRGIFGNIKFSGHDFDDTFSKKAWVAYGDIFVLPRGAGQQVRGLNWMGHRPGLIVIDDLESSENVKSEDQRKKLKQWFYSDLMKTESKYGKPAEFDYIDTIKHEDALLENLMTAPDWTSVKLAICDEEFNTYDENYMTTEEIKQEYENYRAAGETDLFFMELMNIPISLEDAVFKPDYFKYFEEQGDRLVFSNQDGKEETVFVRDLIITVIVDPAKTVKLHSAESAVITIGVHRKSRKIFILETFSDKVYPDQLYDAMFDPVVRRRAFVLAVEVTSLHQFISQPIENEMRVRGIFPIYVELSATGKKEDRVATLAPLYKLGYIYHNRSNCQKLESQLQWFPKSKLWDLMDAEAYITKLMDEQSIYFDPDGDMNEPENFDEIDDDDMKELKGWRVA